MKGIVRYACFAAVAGSTAAMVAIGCGDVDAGGAEDAPADSALPDGSLWPVADGARPDGSRPGPTNPADELPKPGSCEGPEDAGKFYGCDFGFACVYPRANADADAPPEPGCDSRVDAEACGGFWCGRGCRCKDATARVCACQ